MFRAIAVTSDWYVSTLRHSKLEPKLTDLAHLGCTVSTEEKPLELLRELFSGHLIPNTVTLDGLLARLIPHYVNYFLWGYQKSELYKYRPTTIDELKVAIRTTMREIPLEITRR